jgi:hypothetical protein
MIDERRRMETGESYGARRRHALVRCLAVRAPEIRAKRKLRPPASSCARLSWRCRANQTVGQGSGGDAQRRTLQLNFDARFKAAITMRKDLGAVRLSSIRLPHERRSGKPGGFHCLIKTASDFVPGSGRRAQYLNFWRTPRPLILQGLGEVIPLQEPASPCAIGNFGC